MCLIERAIELRFCSCKLSIARVRADKRALRLIVALSIDGALQVATSRFKTLCTNVPCARLLTRSLAHTLLRDEETSARLMVSRNDIASLGRARAHIILLMSTARCDKIIKKLRRDVERLNNQRRLDVCVSDLSSTVVVVVVVVVDDS